ARPDNLTFGTSDPPLLQSFDGCTSDRPTSRPARSDDGLHAGKMCGAKVARLNTDEVDALNLLASSVSVVSLERWSRLYPFRQNTGTSSWPAWSRVR
ncbi:hypothetical protein FRC11_000137, partial [Ceratobasidium sp. 423]